MGVEKFEVKETISANEARIWVNQTLLANCTKADAKVIPDYEDVIVVGDSRTYKRFKGYKIEGTLVIKKVDSFALETIGEGAKTGDTPDVKIVVANARLSDGRTERVGLIGVNFTELPLFNIEAQAIEEQELPFTAEDFEILEKI